MGWSEQCGQGPRVGIDISPQDYVGDAQEGDFIGGSAKSDGSGKRIAKKLLKEHTSRKQSAGRKGEIPFQRDEANIPPRYDWNNQWICNLPPEAFEVLIPEISMYWPPK